MARRLVVWEARHENGWTTTVTEQMNGTFLASVRREGVVGFSSIGSTVEQARVASLAALERNTGHRECSPDCSGWLLTTALAASGSEQPASTPPAGDGLHRAVVRRRPTGAGGVTPH